MPSAPGEKSVRIRCPGCDSSLKLKGAVHPGQQIRCPKCHHEMVVSAKGRRPKHEKPPRQRPATATTNSTSANADTTDEDAWLDDLESLGASSGGAGAAATLPPKVGAPKPRKRTRSVEHREPRDVASRDEPGGVFILDLFGPVINAICGGVLGGVVGGAVWTGLAAWTGFEFGFVAWALGALVGAGVWIGSGCEEGALLGGLAVAIAFTSIWFAKAATIYVIVGNNGLIPADANPFVIAYLCIVGVPFIMSLWDILWFGLAGASAFKIGSGLFSAD